MVLLIFSRIAQSPRGTRSSLLPPAPLLLVTLAWLLLLTGCGARHYVASPDGPVDAGWTERKIDEKELAGLAREDQEIDKKKSLEILARLNIRDADYIQEDITKGRTLKVPNDFSFYSKWTPMPKDIPEASHLPKFILVVKNIPFIGWYEKGRLKNDTYICIGKKGEWTKAGIYKVENKDVDHVSASYKNAYGNPALMPWALRIYGHVWIHAGDIEKANCSHGCINLPIAPAERLFDWADMGTTVLVVESLKDLPKAAKTIPNPKKQPSQAPPVKSPTQAQPPKSPPKT
ncbi:MAG: L,D-transpeptidase [Syntrophobacteraceae bacterium]